MIPLVNLCHLPHVMKLELLNESSTSSLWRKCVGDKVHRLVDGKSEKDFKMLGRSSWSVIMRENKEVCTRRICALITSLPLLWSSSAIQVALLSIAFLLLVIDELDLLRLLEVIHTGVTTLIEPGCQNTLKSIHIPPESSSTSPHTPKSHRVRLRVSLPGAKWRQTVDPSNGWWCPKKSLPIKQANVSVAAPKLHNVLSASLQFKAQSPCRIIMNFIIFDIHVTNMSEETLEKNTVRTPLSRHRAPPRSRRHGTSCLLTPCARRVWKQPGCAGGQHGVLGRIECQSPAKQCQTG